MRIGVDVRSLEDSSQHRGIGRYASELFEALSKIDHSNEYIFFLSNPKAKIPNFNLGKSLKASYIYGRKRGLRGVKFIRILFIKPRRLNVDAHNLDVFFQLDITQPVKARKTPVVSVVYDVIPFLPRFKQQYQHVPLRSFTPREIIGYCRAKLYWKFADKQLGQYKNSTRIVSISEHSKKDLLKLVPYIKPNKVVAVPLAAKKLLSKATKPSNRLKKLDLRKYLFYVGGVDPRKGLVNLVKTLEEVWKKFPDTQLVLAGKEIVDMEVLEAKRLARVCKDASRPKQIIRLGYIEDKELAWLYKHAVGFVFPSRYEGFGLPILEAMQSGCPVITYDNSSLPEVAGKAALVVKDGGSMAPVIVRLLSEPALHDKLVKEGKKQTEKFTWQKTAKQTLDVLIAAARS